MPYVKAVVVSGPDAVDGQLVFGVSVDGLLVKLSTYKALVADGERTSLAMTGQAHSPHLYDIAATAVMDFAIARGADRVRRAYQQARTQRISVRLGARGSWRGACPRCDQAIGVARAGSVVVCRGCGSSILLVGG
jgi:hypothetical protein